MSDSDILDAIAALSSKVDRLWTLVNRQHYSSGTYIGDNVVLTYLNNDNPVLINSDDFGCPMNFLDGGEYEPGNLDVLLSFVSDLTVFLDIGANLGFFSLVIGDRMRQGGKVIAFEPQPDILRLFQRSIHHNGLRDIVDVHAFGLSDEAGSFPLWTPYEHKGGASLGAVGSVAGAGFDRIDVNTVRLDDYLGPDFTCDLVKIDVEGHELRVLRGMSGIVARSPGIKILIEKLGIDTEIDEDLFNYFNLFDMRLHGVEGSRLSEPLSLPAFKAWSGYALATRPDLIDTSDRRRFSMYPRQMLGGSSYIVDGRLAATGPDIMFHGPYWRLPKGVWRLTVHGDLEGELTVAISERFGYEVARKPLAADRASIDFIVERDLVKFECVFRGGAGSAARIERLDWHRVD